jgi:hypothetical protein
MLRKSVQRKRRCALKTNLFGGGLQVAPGTPIESSNGVPYPTNVRYDECYTQARPGSLTTEANVDLAQTAMAGGNHSARHTRRVAGGAVANFVYTPVEARKSRKGRKSRKDYKGGCGCLLKGGQRGGQCPYKAVGGQCPYKAVGGQCGPKVGGKRRTRGGRYGFDVSQSIGGDGPIAEPIRMAIPCDVRAGATNPNTLPLPTDPRAYGIGYSATANTSVTAAPAQSGGELPEYSETMMGGSRGGYGGNGFDPACYKAPGSEMPVYPATSAGFHFTPNIESGAALPPGVIPFNEVIQHTARLGGARKTYRAKSKARKVKKTRKQ